jgi:hypothetical protein
MARGETQERGARKAIKVVSHKIEGTSLSLLLPLSLFTSLWLASLSTHFLCTSQCCLFQPLSALVHPSLIQQSPL